MTNDGELAGLAHPATSGKIIPGLVKGSPGTAALRQLAAGVESDGELLTAARLLDRKPGGTRCWNHSDGGKKRQIRRMCAAVAILSLNCAGLLCFSHRPGVAGGAYRHLKPEEVRRLYRLVD